MRMQPPHSSESCKTLTGVRLGDLLRHVGVVFGAKHVCFRGPKGELPKVRWPNMI